MADLCGVRGTRPGARVFRSRFPVHRKSEPRHRVTGCETLRCWLRLGRHTTGDRMAALDGRAGRGLETAHSIASTRCDLFAGAA
jgi:hypothetical protein